MDTKHSPAHIVHTWLAAIVAPTVAPCSLYYHLAPEGTGIATAAIVVGNSAGLTQRSSRGPQYTQYGIQIMGRGKDVTEARAVLDWAIEAMAKLSPQTPAGVTLDGQLYLLSSAARFGTITELGQTEKHRFTQALQDYRATILKG